MFEDAGHAFDNHESPDYHEPVSAQQAWELTTAFLARAMAPA